GVGGRRSGRWAGRRARLVDAGLVASSLMAALVSAAWPGSAVSPERALPPGEPDEQGMHQDRWCDGKTRCRLRVQPVIATLTRRYPLACGRPRFSGGAC